MASFFVSRVDTAVDKELEKIGTAEAQALCGKIAIANSKVVYRRFMEIFHGEGFASLRSRGARVQRPLWASTGTKNPAYSDVLYVENLIGPETVNTLPPDTINAFRDHGKIPGAMVKTGFDEADAALGDAWRSLGIDLDAITEKLQVDGVAAFCRFLRSVDGALEKKRQAMVGVALNHQELRLGKSRKRVEKRLKDWQTAQVGKRIWEKDHKVWSKDVAAGIDRPPGLARSPRDHGESKSRRSALSPTKPKLTA